MSIAGDLVADWHPTIGQLVGRSDAATVTATTLCTSVRPDHWGSRSATFVGDAIHCMIPSGIGAAVALRDAELLGDRLAAASRGELRLLAAISGTSGRWSTTASPLSTPRNGWVGGSPSSLVEWRGCGSAYWDGSGG